MIAALIVSAAVLLVLLLIACQMLVDARARAIVTERRLKVSDDWRKMWREAYYRQVDKTATVAVQRDEARQDARIERAQRLVSVLPDLTEPETLTIGLVWPSPAPIYDALVKERAA